MKASKKKETNTHPRWLFMHVKRVVIPILLKTDLFLEEEENH